MQEKLIKIRVDIANDLWIDVEKEFSNKALSWYMRHGGMQGDHSFKAKFNIDKGVMEIRKNI